MTGETMLLLVKLRCRLIQLPMWLALICQQEWTPVPVGVLRESQSHESQRLR